MTVFLLTNCVIELTLFIFPSLQFPSMYPLVFCRFKRCVRYVISDRYLFYFQKGIPLSDTGYIDIRFLYLLKYLYLRYGVPLFLT